MPILVGGMIWLIVAFIIQTGSKNKTWKEYDDSFAVWVGAACAVGAALLTVVRSRHHAWMGPPPRCLLMHLSDDSHLVCGSSAAACAGPYNVFGAASAD
jgi:hypothetical protein